MNKLLSIIIPTYNMERFLRKCLDSLVLPDKQMEKLEILVINDGSKDLSSSIGHEYESRYPQSIRVIDKDNGNYGSCINRGLKEASGKYVKILDADDNFDTKQFGLFLNEIAHVEADMILCPFVSINEDGKVIKQFKIHISPNKYSRINEVINSSTFRELQMHSVTYLRKILIDNKYNQSEGISYTDQEWIFTPIYYVQKIYVSQYGVYRYLLGREGQTMDPHVKIKSINHTSKGTIKMIKDYLKMDFSNRDDSFYKYRINLRMGYLYKNYILKNHNVLPANDLIKFDSEIKDVSEKVYGWGNELNLLCGFLKYVKMWRTNPDSILLKLIRVTIGKFV